MKKSTKEIIWPIALLIVSYLIFNPRLVFFNPTEDTTTDINIKDAYFVVEHINILILIITLIFFMVYFVRALISRFRNTIINSVFLLSNLGMIIITSFIIKSIEPMVEPGNKMLEKMEIFFIGIRIFLIITLVLAAIKTVINIKNSRKV